MAELRAVRIAGTGSYVPPKVVTNDDLAQLMTTSNDWIVERTGIKERRFVDEEGKGPAYLGMMAAKQAMHRAGVSIADIDLIVVATLSPEHYFPGTSVFIQRLLEAGTTPAMDVRCQCSGFLYAMETARCMIAAGQYERILVVGAEVHSRALDFSDRGRDTAVLFGDGAGAVVLARETEPERGILRTVLHAEGTYAEKLWVQYPTLASSPHISAAHVEAGDVFPRMEGKTVFRHAVKRLPEVIGEVLGDLHLRPADVDLFIFHQANLRINEAACSVLGVSPSKTFNTIQKYGNCSAASIPICLSEALEEGRLKSGDLVCMAGFGSGFTWGATVMRW